MSDTTTNRVLRAALCGLVLALAATTGEARSPVGVTTASDGDPLGKPPDANERILRIGIDVQANELVTTAARDRAHLVFLDGSSLTVGPNARVVIDRFIYDPASNTGDLAINASRGILRLVGGRISKQKPIVITTPSSTIGVRGGITILTVTPTETVANFVYGNSMTVTAGGQTQTATRAGSQVVTAAGGVPSTPSLLKQGGLGVALNQLEGATANANNAPDQSAQRSGFSRQNSGQPANAGPNGPPNLSNNALVNAISNASVETQQVTRPGMPPSGPVTAATPNNPVTPQPPTGGTGPSIPPPLPPAPSPSGTPRTSQTLTGIASGLVYGQPDDGGYHSTPANLLGKPGTVSITTDATTSQAKGTIVLHDLGGSRRPSVATLQLGGTGGLGATNSAFVDDKSYVMVTQYNDLSRLSSWEKGGVRYQATDTSVLQTASAGLPLQLPMQGTPGPCVCEFLTWGWWAAGVPDPRHPGRTYTAVGPYVAGTPTASFQMPQTGSATYAGFMVGVVNNAGNVYGGAGSYQNTWNFANRSGVFNGTFDGRAYSGTTQATAGSNGQTFTGTFSGGGGTGGLNGAFFASPTDAAKYQAGTFSIGNNSAPYKASGVFAGQR
jgi:FecR-like protein